MERRLAAILSADVVGYSRLTAQDETSTLFALGSLRRNIIDPVVQEHNGRVFKTMGDGLLVEFQSAVAAVECALEWQERSADAQASLNADHRLLFRIGVNLGEVVVDGTDLLGDGVNVAARLEGEAVPGGVCISEDVHHQIRGKVTTQFEDGGERKLKNMPRPVRVFQTAASDLDRAETDGARYRATLFGNFRFSGPDGSIEISSRKLRGLLSYLAITHAMPQPRERLMELFWGSHFGKQARQNLRQAITRLKRLLGPDVLEIDDDTLALRAGQMTSDVERLGRVLEDPSPDALRAISGIGSCELLADLTIAEESWTEWLGNERSRQRDRLVDATVGLGGLELADGNFQEALGAAERALEFDPHREDAFRIAVQALVGLGRNSSAVARFAEFRRRLDDDLAVGPSEDTQALMASLAAKPAGEPARNVSPVDGPAIPDEPSLAVVPFRNITGDERADIIRNGLAEDIVTTLAKISSILVVARSSTQGYQDNGADWQKISNEQGVRYLVEGAIRLVGDRVRVTAHLRDAITGREIWADRFDRWFRDFLDIQDEITKEVVSALQVQLTDGEQARIWARGTDDTRAWENVVVATELIHAHHREGIAQARVLAEEAIRLDPGFAAGLAAVGWTHWVEGRWGWADSRERFATAAEYAERALGIDPKNPDALALNGVVLLHLGRFDAAIEAMEEAMRNAPSHANIVALTGYVHRYAGEPRRVIACMERAIRLSPVHPVWYRAVLANGLWHTGETPRALECFREAHRRDPDFTPALAMCASMLGELGRTKEAWEVIESLVSADPSFSARLWCDLNPFRNTEDREREFEGLMKAGIHG